MRKLKPKPVDHPSIGEECHVCKIKFMAGDYTKVVEIGVDNNEDRRKRDAGQPYNAVAIEVHWDCRPREAE